MSTVLDLVNEPVASFFSRHQFFTTIATEVLLIILVYLFVQRALEQREDMRWMHAAMPSLTEIRTAGAALWAGIAEVIRELPERHAGESVVAAAASAVARHVDMFKRVLDTHRSMLAATPTLAGYLQAADAVRVDATQFTDDLKFARGGARTGEWYEESTRAMYQTYERFELVYAELAPIPEMGVVHRLRIASRPDHRRRR